MDISLKEINSKIYIDKEMYDFYIMNRKAYGDSVDNMKIGNIRYESSVGHYYEIRLNNKRIGEIIRFYEPEEDVEEFNIAIFDIDNQGKGYAKKAIEIYLSDICDKSLVEACIRNENPNKKRIIHLLESLGFKHSKQIDNVWEYTRN